MATPTEGRATIDYDGDEWYIFRCIKPEGNSIVCHLMSRTRGTYTPGDTGEVPLQTIVALDRDAVIQAELASAAMRSGTLGVCLFGEFHPLPQ